MGLLLAGLLREVLAPIFIALAIGYVGDPIIDRFEERGVSRTLGIVILITFLLLVMAGLGIYLIPKLVNQVQELTEAMPKYWSTFREKFLPEVQDYLADHQEQVTQVQENVVAWIQENAGMLLKSVSAAIAASFKSIGAFVSNILSLVIIPVLAFYFLRDFDLMKEKAAELLPLKHRDGILALFRDIDQSLGNFIQGQLLVALILAFIYSVGLTIAGCPASLLIGILAGFANLVPYLGLALGFVPAVLLTYLSGNPTWQVVLSGLTFVIGQLLEGMVITPKVVGDSVGLHPAFVMVALMIGGEYFGFAGMILALPVAAVLMVILRRLYLFYIQTPIYQETLAAQAEAEGKEFKLGDEPALESGPETKKIDPPTSGSKRRKRRRK